MTLAKTDTFLESLYNLRRQCLELIEAAEDRNDVQDAVSLHRHLLNIDSIIEERGGDPHA